MGFTQNFPRRTGAHCVPGAAAAATDVLMLSMRQLDDLVAYCMTYEFEDVISEMTGAHRIDVGDEPALEFSRRVYKLSRYATGSRQLARMVTPPPAVVELDRDYELFFPTFNHAYELFALATIPDWRKRCRVAACYVAELWVKELPEYLLELLGDFDHIFLGVSNPVAEVARIAGRPCSYLPIAADVLRFTPYPDPPPRHIDVCNIGRRSAVTHGALLRLARERRIHYHFDTVAASGIDKKQRSFHVHDAAEHRLLLAGVLQRSRYYFASRARVNEPEFTLGREEISGRYYEGAAAGSVMIGEPPDSDEFRRLFDWEDAVIRVPFDCPDIADRLVELDRDPQRLADIARRNTHQAALRHDWSHRLRSVFQTLGIRETPAMQARDQRLQQIAAMAEGALAR